MKTTIQESHSKVLNDALSMIKNAFKAPNEPTAYYYCPLCEKDLWDKPDTLLECPRCQTIMNEER